MPLLLLLLLLFLLSFYPLTEELNVIVISLILFHTKCDPLCNGCIEFWWTLARIYNFLTASFIFRNWLNMKPHWNFNSEKFVLHAGLTCYTTTMQTNCAATKNRYKKCKKNRFFNEGILTNGTLCCFAGLEWAFKLIN